MKAIVLTGYGDVDKLDLREVPDPQLEARALLVRVAAASVNPIDWKMRSGAAKKMFPLDFPAILGRDASGEVVRVGEGVTTFRIGDRVLGLVNGAYAELVAAPVESWAKVPEGLDVVEAGALPLVLLTGAQLMERAVAPSPGSTVLVTGALGSVGRVAVHAAKLARVKAWAGVRGSQRDEAEKLGVEGVVVLDGPAPGADVPTFDAIADTVGGDAIQRLYEKLRRGGTIGSVLGEPAGAKERGFVVHAFMSQPDSALLARYAAEVAQQRLVIPIAKQLPLARAREAHQLVEKQHVPGKILLVP